MGPTHGVQPMAKVRPTAKEPMKPAGLLWMWSCWVRPKSPMRRTPAMYRPKITMMAAARDPDPLAVVEQELAGRAEGRAEAHEDGA